MLHVNNRENRNGKKEKGNIIPPIGNIYKVVFSLKTTENRFNQMLGSYVKLP